MPYRPSTKKSKPETIADLVALKTGQPVKKVERRKRLPFDAIKMHCRSAVIGGVPKARRAI